jgi:hypothetical protein
MSKRVTLHLDEFGRQALERVTGPGTGSDGAVVGPAALYYLADRKSGRAALRVPSIAADARHGHGLEVSLDDATWAAVAEEAERQGVRPETLAAHAVLYFLADLDSRRISGLLEDALDENE